MDEQIAIDRILEIENLTDELDDDQANYVLDWAAKHAGTLVKDVSDEDAAGDKVNALAAVLRKVNALSAQRADQSADQMQGEIKTFAGLVEEAFGAPPVLGTAQGVGSSMAQRSADAPPPKLAEDLKAQDGLDFVKSMLALAETALTNNPSAPPPATSGASATQPAVAPPISATAPARSPRRANAGPEKTTERPASTTGRSGRASAESISSGTSGAKKGRQIAHDKSSQGSGDAIPAEPNPEDRDDKEDETGPTISL